MQNTSKKSSKSLSIFKTILIIVVGILLLGFLLLKLADSFFNKNLVKIYSPDNLYYAQVTESNGGATTGYVTSVSVFNEKSIFSYSRLMSIWSGNSFNVFSTNGPGESINTTWDDNKTLKVKYSDCNKIYNKVNNWNDIKVVYEGSCEEFNSAY